MSIDVKCDCCGEALTEPGALLFGPPQNGLVSKRHICVRCWHALLACATWVKP